MASKPKLVYFDGRGRGEIIRLIFVAANKPFEDERITFEQWGALKANAKFNALPNIVIGGKTYGQSLAIAQYLAREYGLYGSTNLEALVIDEAIQTQVDIRNKIVPIRFEKDEAKKAKDLEAAKKTVPKLLQDLEELAKENKNNGFFVSTKLSLADISMLDSWDWIKEYFPELETNYPGVKKIKEKVASVPAIKTHLASRKVTPF